MTEPRWIPDNSAIAAFRENPELFRLKYRLHLVPATPDDKMRAGSALHAGRNVLYDWRKLNEATQVEPYPTPLIERAAAVARAHRGEGGGHRSAEQVETVLRTYAVKYAVEPFAVVENEKYVEVRIHAADCKGSACEGRPFGENAFGCFDFCGIQDAKVRFPDGSEYIADLKSTGAYLGAAWEQAQCLNDQFVGYVAMERAAGRRCDGFIVDAIHMRDAKPRKDGTLGVPSVTEDDFQRVGPVSVPEWRIERWARDVRHTLAQIAALEAERGIDTPWPIHANWPYGKVDTYAEFYETPPELHAQVARQFERRAWSPADVAKEREVK